MKRFLVSILVPAAAAIAVVGSGFSVWYFGDKQVETNSSASLEVKNLLHIGTFQDMSNTFKLTLDQTSEGRTKALELAAKTGDALADLEKTGITLTNTDADPVANGSVITYKAPTQANATDQGTFGGTNVKVEITTKFTIDTTLAKWVKVSSVAGGGTLSNTGNVYTYTWKAKDTTAAQTSLDLVGGVTFAYADYNDHYNSIAGSINGTARGTLGCEPLNAAEYDVMYQAIKGITTDAITINTVATLVK